MNASNTDDFTSENEKRWKKKTLNEVRSEMKKIFKSKYDQWLFFKFFKIARGSRLTEKRIKKMLFEEKLIKQERNLLLEMLYRWEAALTWNFSKIEKVRKKIISSQKIKTMKHETWQTSEFFILKTLNEVIVEMLRERIDNEMLKSCHELYWNSWFLMKKKSNKYRMINAIMNINKVIIRDVNLPSDVDDFS